MPHIQVVRTELQCLGIGFGGLVMSAEARQRVPLQAEQACVGDAGDTSLLGEAHGGAEVPATNREQRWPHCAVATRRGAAAIPAIERGERRIGVACRFLRRGQAFTIGGIRRDQPQPPRRGRLRHPPGASVPASRCRAAPWRRDHAVENDRLRRIRGRAVAVIHLQAEFGSALAQVRMAPAPALQPRLAHRAPGRADLRACTAVRKAPSAAVKAGQAAARRPAAAGPRRGGRPGSVTQYVA